jgi:hypothetical protein
VSAARKRADRGIWRGVYSSMLSHPDYTVLSPHARLTLLTLRIGGQSTPAGIGRVYMDALVTETGLSRRRVEEALVELEERPSREAPWILRDGNLIWIRNALRFDPTLTLRNRNHVPTVQRALAALPRSSPVVERFRRYYVLPELREATPVASAMASDGLSPFHPPSHPPSHAPSHGGSGSRSRNPKRKRIPIPNAGESLSVGSNDELQRRTNGEPEPIASTLQAMGKRMGFGRTE